MNAGDYRSTAARIRQEVPERQNEGCADSTWAYASRDAHDLLVDAAALNIPGLHAGLERVFVGVAERIDGSLPGGQSWHQDLLRQMTADLPGVRQRFRQATSLRCWTATGASNTSRGMFVPASSTRRS